MPRAKRFLILQLRPEDATADNELHAIMKYGGLQPDDVQRVRVEQTGLHNIRPEQFAGIIVGGSPYDVSTPDELKSPLQNSVEREFHQLLDAVTNQDLPFLGCCSGNGLLGSYCGASISRRFGEPVGGTDVRLTEAGRKDPLLRGLPDRFRVLVGHKEACDSVPAGCTLLATSDSCPVQMFRLHTNIYATQFHPEGDAEGFALRIRVYRDYGYFPPETADTLIQTITNENTPEARQILQRFVDRYRD